MMSCNLWIHKGFPYVEGRLSQPEIEGYEGHLAVCPTCRSEIALSRELVLSLKSMPESKLGTAAARDFDRRVLMRIVPAVARATTAAAPAYGQARDPGRAAAARSIATRSRRAGTPLFAGERPALEPSFMLTALGITIASMATTVFFGEWMVRAIGSRFAAATAALGDSGAWLSAQVTSAMVALVAMFRIVRGVLIDLSPWFDATRELVATRGAELLMFTAATTLLIGAGAALLKRDRTKMDDAARL
jgi:hypothetical protein